MTTMVFTPLRPSKSSAGTRRHHRKYLAFHLHQIVPGAVSVLVTPVTREGVGCSRMAFVLVVFGPNGRHMRVPAGATDRIVALLQNVFPTRDWARCQTWRAATNDVTEYRPTVPADLVRAL
jgi:hypothetical protein